MRFYIFIFTFLFSEYVFSQTEEEYKVKYVVDTFFEGLNQSDSLKMKTVMHVSMTLQSIQPNDIGEVKLLNQNIPSFLKLVTQYAKARNWEEELQSYVFNIDGSLAQVWSPYKFYLNGMLSHCGANSIQLFYDNKQWKIVSILDTRRKNCEE